MYFRARGFSGIQVSEICLSKPHTPILWNVSAQPGSIEAVISFLIMFCCSRRVESEKLKFDVVIVESLCIPWGCGMLRLLSEAAPIISMTTVAVDHNENHIGSRMHLSFVPTILSPYTDRMSFWEKLENWIFYSYFLSMSSGVFESAARRFFKDNYGAEAENLVEGCWSNVSLVLVTSNPLYFYPRLLAPNVVEVGPLHLKSPPALPKVSVAPLPLPTFRYKVPNQTV